jgi:aryl-alcohol dehydrogenase-like predicted oxidoreductase
MKALTDKLVSIGQRQGAAAPEVATAWAIAKGTTPIIGVTQPNYIDGLARATNMTLSSDDIAALEALADAAHVNTRGWWEKDMQV